MSATVWLRILGYCGKKDESQQVTPIWFNDQSKTRRYVPLTSQGSSHVHVIQDLHQLIWIDHFDVAMDAQWYDNIFRLFCDIHAVLDSLGETCATGTPTEKQWREVEKPWCTFFCESDIYDDAPPCPHLEHHGPFYLFAGIPPTTEYAPYTNYWYIVHPDEKERMERILNGTDNPLYDLVHELRYNPVISPAFNRERQECQQDLESGGTKRTRLE